MDYSNKKIKFLHSKKIVQITQRIHTSEHSQWYLCTDNTQSNKKYCLKISSSKNDDKATNSSINIEIVILLSLAKEKNIIHIVDYCSNDTNSITTYFVLMEYAENGTWLDWIRTNANSKSVLSEGVVYKYIYQIANGWRSLHNNKYSHRDLRPDNILLSTNNNTSDDNIKICDFASSSNKYYDTISHNIRNDIVVDISRNTQQYFRAPEFIEWYNGFQINEKSDIWNLGIILYMMLFSYLPKNQFEVSYVLCGKVILAFISNEIKKLLNPYFYELLRLMLKENPKERKSANEVISYLEKYKDNLIKTNGSVKERWTFSMNLQEKIWMYMTNSSTRNIKAIVNKLMWNNWENFPEKNAINLLVELTFNNKKKVNKFYQCLSNTPILYFTFCGLKALYIIHTYIFNHNIDAINPQNFNIDELLVLHSNIYSTRIMSNSFDKNENIKSMDIIKYVISYCEFLKIKIGLWRKHGDVIENNNSIITTDYYTKLVNKSLIEDCLCLFLKTFQVITAIPFNNNLITNTLDCIASILNEEWTTLFNLLYFLIIAYKNIIVENTNLENQFVQIGNKANGYLEKLRKYRNDINSSNKVIFFSKGLKEAFDYWKSIKPENNNFNIKKHFDANCNINYFGIKWTRSKYTLYEAKEKENEYDVKYFIEPDGNWIGGDNEVSQYDKDKKNGGSNGNYIANQSHNSNNNAEQGTYIGNSNNISENNNNTNLSFKKEGDDFNTFNSIIDDFWNKEDLENYRTDESNNNSNNLSSSIGNNAAIFSFIDPHNNSLQNVQYIHQLQQNHLMNLANINNIGNINQAQQAQSVNNSFMNQTAPQIYGYGATGNGNNTTFINNCNQSQISNNTFPFQNGNFNNNGNYYGNITRNIIGTSNHIPQQIKANPTQIGNNNTQNNVVNPMNHYNQGRQNVNNPQMNISNHKNIPININNQINSNSGPSNYYYQQPQQVQNGILNPKLQTNQAQYQGYQNNTNNQMYINKPNIVNTNIQNSCSAQQTSYQVHPLQSPQPNTMNANDIQSYTNNSNYINDYVNPIQPQTYNKMNSNISNVSQQNQLYPQIKQQQYPNTLSSVNNQQFNNWPQINNAMGIQNHNNSLLQTSANPSNIVNDKDMFESVASQLSNINIFNIVENYNIENNVTNTTIKQVSPPQDQKIEKIANDFLVGELSRPNFHFLIASKDITFGKSIGFGGSSEVFIGYYRGTEVAVKKLRILEVKEENLKEFKREVSSLSMLRHPNWVLFMGAIAEPNHICIVTEYCEGGTLFNILHQRLEMNVPWPLRIRILLEIATGMNFLHTNDPPIIHRDLKSLNILLTNTIEKPTDLTSIKISDFGLSKIIFQLDSTKEAMTGQWGTCHWMAPEVIKSTNYSIKADVYSFAIIIWEICTRHTPYKDMTQQQISFYVSVKKGRPDKKIVPESTPTGLIKLMEECWNDNPDIRPSFQQIIPKLKAIHEGL